MVISAGLLVIKNNKILLCHPTNAKWLGYFSIPKGHVEEHETNKEDYIDTAIRETFEETGLLIDYNLINKKEYCINYIDKKGKTYKQVYYYIANVKDSDLPDNIIKEQLQLSEVDWAGFLTYEEAETKLFWRFKTILEHLKKI